MNTNTKEASAICEIELLLCDGEKVIHEVDYESEEITVFPLDIMKNIPSSAEVFGSEVINNRKATIISYVNADGKNEKVSIDDFYGIPLKWIIYEVIDEDEIVLEKYTFNKLGANNVKTADVTPPEDYN